MARAANGTYAVAGQLSDAASFGSQTLVSSGGDDLLLVQYSAGGVPVWASRAGGPGCDGATGLAADASGNLYVAGYFAGSAVFGNTTLVGAGDYDGYLAKYSAAGDLLWVRQLSGPQFDYATAVAVDNAGAVVVAGQYQQTLTLGAATLTSANTSAFLAKYDDQGSLLWSQSLSGSIGGLATDAAGQVYAAGVLPPSGGFVAKFTVGGVPLWTSPGTGGAAAGTAVTVDGQGRVFVAGRFRDTLPVGPATATSAGSYDGFLAGFDAAGVGRWVQALGGADEDQATAVALAGPGTVAVTGYVRGSATLAGQAISTGGACAGAFVAGFDPLLGTPQWQRSPGGTVAAMGSGLAFEPTGSNGVVVGTFWGELTLGSSRLNSACVDEWVLTQLTTNFPDLTVVTAQPVQGSYRNVTVTGTGVATLAGPLQVTGALGVQSGGQLLTGSLPVSGPGSFALADGATLATGHPAGLATMGPTGAIQVAGPRSFSPGGRYGYTGPAAQVTGPGLPAQVRSLAVDNPAGLTLTAPLAVAETLTLTQGPLVLNGQMLTLLSTAAGTAQVDNPGGTVQGVATVQRYLDPARNAGSGYRHLAAPVQNPPVAGLATAAFVPVTNPAYNTSPAPNTVAPSPTVFAYDETRLATAANNLSGFEKGWYSPASNAAPLLPLHGYSVQLAAAQTVAFVGPLNAGPYARTLSRGSAPDAGWALLGNPYPATLDWRRVAVPAGLDNAMYVFESSGPYAGQYRSYVNGIGNPLIALGQGFLVRASSPNTPVTLTLTDAARAPDWASAPPLYRAAPDRRPRLVLALHGAAPGPAAETTVYFETGATAGVDARFDALKPQSPVLPDMDLSTATAAGDVLSINGLPPLRTPRTVPVSIRVAQAGPCQLVVRELVNFQGIRWVLTDAVTGRRVPLVAGAAYAFAATPGSSQRFRLQFSLR